MTSIETYGLDHGLSVLTLARQVRDHGAGILSYLLSALRLGPIVSLVKMQTFSLADNAEDASHPPVMAAPSRQSVSVGSLPPPPSNLKILLAALLEARFFSLTRKKPSFSGLAFLYLFCKHYQTRTWAIVCWHITNVTAFE